MCGIVGYYGSKESVMETLISGLKRLEYRGYDSSGIAAVTQENKVFSVKAVGRIQNLEQKISDLVLPNLDSVGIAHTRWATHGVPSEDNAHPHSGVKKKIWVVHNGIIENYQTIKNELMRFGIEFYSQTDTEVIAKLIEFNYQNELREAVMTSLNKLEGAYALAIISSDQPGRIIGAKKGSPLILGVAPSELILASDVSAMINKTREVIYLEDNELVDINQGQYQIINLENKLQIPRKSLEKIEWSEEDASKEGFSNFMSKEITQQKKSILETLRGRIVLESAEVKFGGLIDVHQKLREIEKVVILGIGSSFFAAHAGELFFEKLAGITAKAEMSAEFRYKASCIDDKTWVIAISQSGETADTIGAILEAKRRGALVTGIVNVVGSTISRITDAGVYNHIGPELSVASTKATTSQYVLILMHAILLGRMRNLDFAESLKILQDLKNIDSFIEQVLGQWEKIGAVAKKFFQVSSFLFLGRNYNFPISREGAIKLKEISYIHAEAFSGGELKHGPIAMIDEHFPTLVICNQDNLYEKQINTIAEINARKGPVIGLGDFGDEYLPLICNEVIRVPKTETAEVQAIVNMVALQIFAYEMANIRGLDIDKPRNLAKSVTVE